LPEGFRRNSTTRIGASLGAARTGLSIYELPPGQASSPYHYEDPVEEWLLVVSGTPTLRHPGGEQQLEPWDIVFFDETILGELIVSPVDLERSNPHMWHDTFHGGDRSLANSGALRPAPGWAQHRMPIPGLYQTGGTTHPGGSVTGGPGRNAAIVMLSDLGHDPAVVMGAGA
jgi:phytoene dehydrogenase-like protein